MNLLKSSAPEEWATSEKALIGVGVAILVIAGAVTWGYQWLNAMPVATVPTPNMTSPNAFDDYMAAGNTVLDTNKIVFAILSHHPASGSVPEDRNYALTEKETLVHENAAPLKILHMGLSKSYINPAVRSYSTLLPYYSKFHGLARLLTLEGQVAVAHNDYGAAVNANLDALQMGIEIPHGSPLIGGIVGISCQSSGRRPIWDALDHLNARDAKSAVHRLEKILKRHEPVADTLQEAKWCGQAGMLELFQNPNWHALFAGATGSSVTVPHLESALFFTNKRAVFENYTRYMDQMIAYARVPYASHPKAPTLPTDAINQILLVDATPFVFRDVLGSQTQNALLLTALALRAYREDNGCYPDSLNALAPTYFTKVPDDPFALSGALKYIRRGTRTILYSIGPDGVDDNGKAIFDSHISNPSASNESDRQYWVTPTSKGDIMAGININSF